MVIDVHEEIILETAAGRLKGRKTRGVAGFKGIPYGESVSGERRWTRAMPVAPWSGMKDALEYGPRAIQPESRDLHVTSGDIERVMLAGGPSNESWKVQNEECLTLSVWTPQPIARRNLPVMFWCHGGKYFGETPPVWWFDGGNLAEREQVVVVTVRHRVGVLGFLNLADLPGGSTYRDSANVGMLDLVLALQWVKDNIGAFGGDPDNVTLYGQSGGGLKVSVLLRMPEASGLFHKAIIQSGAQMEAMTRIEGTETALALMAELGLGRDDVDKLIEVPAQQLVAAQVRLTPTFQARLQGAKLIEFEPWVDGVVLPADSFDPVASATSRNVSLLIGTCATETTFFLSSVPGVFEMSFERLRGMLGGMFGSAADGLLGVYRASRPDASPTELFFAVTSDFLFRRRAIRMAELKAEQATASVYMYQLKFETDIHSGHYRTPHILDLPLVFANPDHPILGSDPARFAVSRQMTAAWAAFAREGNPNTDLLPHWPAYDAATRATMQFCEPPLLVRDPYARERQAW